MHLCHVSPWLSKEISLCLYLFETNFSLEMLSSVISKTCILLHLIFVSVCLLVCLQTWMTHMRIFLILSGSLLTSLSSLHLCLICAYLCSFYLFSTAVFSSVSERQQVLTSWVSYFCISGPWSEMVLFTHLQYLRRRGRELNKDIREWMIQS